MFIIAVFVGAFALNKTPFNPTRANLIRLILIGIPVLLVLLALGDFVGWVMAQIYGFDYRFGIDLPTTLMEWGTLFWLIYLVYIAALFLTGAVWTGYEFIKIKLNAHSFKEIVRYPLARYNQARQKFIEEWGFSGLFFECLPALMASYILTALAAVSTGLYLLAVPSGIINFFIFGALLVIYVEYLFNPRQTKRIKYQALKRLFKIESDSQLRLFLAVVITATLFGAFWVNYSLSLINFYLLDPRSFTFPSDSSLNHPWDWFFLTFRLMINGDFNVEVRGIYAQTLIATISISEFLFLGLFFSQMFDVFRTQVHS